MRTPVAFVGEVNLSKDDPDRFMEYLREHFNLESNNYLAQQATLNASIVDLTFSGYIHLICKQYVVYFSYHFPIFKTISLYFTKFIQLLLIFHLYKERV